MCENVRKTLLEKDFVRVRLRETVCVHTVSKKETVCVLEIERERKRNENGKREKRERGRRCDSEKDFVRVRQRTTVCV